MTGLPKEQRGKPNPGRFILLWGIGVSLVVLFAAILLSGYQTWQAYNETFASRSADEDWLHRATASYSVDVYDEQLTVRRLEVYCLRFAIGDMSKAEFSVKRRQVFSTIAMFAPGSVLARAVSGHETFPAAYAALQEFVDAASRLEDGKAKIQDVVAMGEGAGKAWEALTVEANDKEFALRDGMENAVRDTRPLIDKSFKITGALVALCAMLFAAAAYATARALRAELKRFERFELLLATVGHDLRSPLQALVGAAKLAAADAQPAEREKFVRIVHERSAFFTRLLDDLVNLARSDSLSFVPAPVNLTAWFDAAVGRYRQQVESKGLSFEARISGLVAVIKFDPERLTQCVDNLMSNAVRYTDAGKIKLVVRCDPIKGRKSVAQLTIRVTDTGRGIADADRHRIFEPFVRVESDVSGMGVGLSMVSNLANQIGGTVTVRSAIGIGSRFTFRVPSVEVIKAMGKLDRFRVEPVRPPINEPAAPTSTIVVVPRVLVVDDDPVITMVVSGLLPHMGFAADVANGGKAGLDMAKRHSYCAVLTDLQMPELDGFELAAALRGALTPCPLLIAMTAYTSKPASDPRAGVFDEMLTKPFDDERLGEILDRAATRWAAMPS